MTKARAGAARSRFDPRHIPSPGTLEPHHVRKAARSGSTAVMRSCWRDPLDDNPRARSAREITGWRGYCTLRAAVKRNNSAITERHIYAADRLRQACDLAAIGASGPREILPVVAIVYGPRGGPSYAALAQTRGWRDFQRAMAQFDASQRLLLTMVILLNYSVSAWCAMQSKPGRVVYPTPEMQRLVLCLERLAEHYASEIDEDLAKGRLLAA